MPDQEGKTQQEHSRNSENGKPQKKAGWEAGNKKMEFLRKEVEKYLVQR
jgi:hypothetical protein